MTQFNRMPTYQEELTLNNATTRGWFSFWAGLFTGQPTGPASTVRLGISPFNYVASVGGTVIVSGGTVTRIQVSRDGVNFFDTGQITGVFPLSQGDTLTVTYAVLPTMTFMPR